jgi:histidine triad (HIT) family protein
MMGYDENNIFAKILRKEVPCETVYEDEKILAFRDIQPCAPVHVLVIPKEAYISFQDFSTRASPEDIVHYFKTVSRIACDLKLSDKGFRLVANTGSESGNMVPHFHTHIIGGKQLGDISGA